MATLKSCPHCAKRVDSSLENCPYCGGFLHAGDTGPKESAARRQTENCPNCSAVVQPGDIICVACGTNLLTGQKIVSETQTSRTTRPQVSVRSEINWPIVGGIAAAIVIVVLGGLAAYTWTRDPVNQAVSLAQQGRVSEATELLIRYTDQNPEDPRGHMELGKLHWRSRQFLDAEASFREVARLEPANRRAVYLTILAGATTRTAVSRPNEVAMLESYVRAAPQDGEAWFLLALARGTTGDSAGQTEALSRAVELGFDAAALQQAQGVSQALAGNSADALRVLRQALTTAPDSPDLRAAAGFVANLEGVSDDAASYLNEAVANNTSLEKEATLQLGLLHLRKGEFDAASQRFQEVLRIDNDNQSARFYQAVARQGMGLRPEALGAFESLMRMEQSPYAAEAALRAATLYLAEGDADRAMDAIERAQRQGASNASYYTTRGRVLARMGRETEAQDSFRSAVQADSEYAPAHLENGLMYVRRQMFGEGIRALQRYVDTIDPALPDARVEQVRALIDQLRQTERDTTAPARGGGRTAK
jgi:tetratricopeptide (TPR) repeat protein/RNA polymerase subunit RPABC4/transcription elongation factor Spt4